jgi:hypothetical protein
MGETIEGWEEESGTSRLPFIERIEQSRFQRSRSLKEKTLATFDTELTPLTFPENIQKNVPLT